MVSILAEKKQVLPAPRTRVWELLAAVTLQELPLEQVDIVDLDSFNAILRWKWGFVSFPFSVSGKLVDTVNPESFGCVMSAKRGPVKVGVKVLVTLHDPGGNRTELVYRAFQSGKDSFLGWCLKKQQSQFALSMFNAIGERLQQLCQD